MFGEWIETEQQYGKQNQGRQLKDLSNVKVTGRGHEA